MSEISLYLLSGYVLGFLGTLLWCDTQEKKRLALIKLSDKEIEKELGLTKPLDILGDRHHEYSVMVVLFYSAIWFIFVPVFFVFCVWSIVKSIRISVTKQ